MKKSKIGRLAALLAASSLLFAGFFTSCKSDDDEGEDSTVSKITMNGTAYETIAAALAAIPTTGDTSTYKIVLQPGTYNENYLNYNGSATVKISGNTSKTYGSDVIITGHGTAMGQEKGRELLEVQGSGDLILENITLLSDYSRTDHSGDVQAEVLGFDSTGTVAAYNCAFKSHQDTMRTTGKGWFYKCYVEGDTDFIWMESTGIVALYEECEIVSVYDENASTHASYILAPRANVENSLGKGAVIFNSTVTLSENQDTYLFRNPWGTNTSYYNQGAFVNVSFSGNGTLNADLAKSAAMGTSDQQYIGWKIDSTIASNYSSKLSSIGVLSDTTLENEYSGRRAILNRNYSTKTEAFSKDVENYWDIDSFIKENNWSVETDSSKALLDGETESTITTYILDSESVEGLTAEGFALESGKTHWVGTTGSTIKFNVTGKCIVAVTGYYKGSGTITAGTQGDGIYNVTNGSTSKYLTTEYVVYSEDTNEVTITATETSYLTKITVTYDSAIEFVPVTSIDITTADDAETVTATKSLQCSATVTPSNASNTDFTWSISNGSDYAEIDSKGLLTAKTVDSEQTITVRATANDTNAVYTEKSITIEPLSASAFDIQWLDNTTADFSATNSAEGIATGSTASVPSSGTNTTGETVEGTYAYNSSKITATGGVTLTAADDDATPGEWYVEYPITAVKNLRINDLKIWWGNPGTGNLRVYIQYYKNSEDPVVIYDDRTSTGVVPRNSVNENSTFTVNKVLSAGDTAKIRVSIHSHRTTTSEDGSETDSIQSISGKSPTWGKTIISGEAGEFPVEGETYEYNLCSTDNLKAAGSTSDELFSWTNANFSSGHGLQGGTGTLKVAGNVKITAGLCKYDSGTLTVTNGETAVAELTVVKMTACYAKGVSSPTFDDTNSQSFTYTGDATELTLVWSGNVYLEGLKVEPISE